MPGIPCGGKGQSSAALCLGGHKLGAHKGRPYNSRIGMLGGGSVGGGEGEPEGAAVAGGALDADLAAQLPDDPLHDR